MPLLCPLSPPAVVGGVVDLVAYVYSPCQRARWMKYVI